MADPTLELNSHALSKRPKVVFFEAKFTPLAEGSPSWKKKILKAESLNFLNI